MEDKQSYANHTRWYPLVHFITVPILILNLGYQVFRLYQERSLDRGALVVMSVAFMLITLSARRQSLKAQDRVIRLEERLRYKEILSPELAEKAANMMTGRIIALRFASDGELAGLVSQVLDGRLNTAKEIKLAIKDWRGDYHRV